MDSYIRLSRLLAFLVEEVEIKFQIGLVYFGQSWVQLVVSLLNYQRTRPVFD